MGSRRIKIPTPPLPNPNAAGATAGQSTYNVPVVSPYDSGQAYTPFFMQQAVNPMEGQPMSYFNRYGSVGNDPEQLPYMATGGGISNNVTNFAQSASRVRLGGAI